MSEIQNKWMTIKPKTYTLWVCNVLPQTVSDPPIAEL